MWDVFEHYKFLKHLFDFNTDKVQECAFFSLLANTVFLTVGYFNYFASHILGVSVSFIIMVAIVMVIDLFTGLRAAKKEEQRRTSKKGLRWVFKLLSYVLFMYIFNTFLLECKSYGYVWAEYPLNLLKLYIIVHILFWETKSIDENLERLGYSLRILKLADDIFSFVKELVKKKYEEKSSK